MKVLDADTNSSPDDRLVAGRQTRRTALTALTAVAAAGAFSRAAEAGSTTGSSQSGSQGALLFRDTGAFNNVNFLPGVPAGSVLSSGGSSSPPVWSDTPSLKSIVSTAFEAEYPYVAEWMRHDPRTNGVVGQHAGYIGGYTFGFTYQPVSFSNGVPSYVNDTWHLGVNVGSLDGGVGRADTSKPNLALSFESKFYQSGVFAQEFHLQGVTTDGATTFRPLSVFAAHDASIVAATFTVDVFNVNDKQGNNLLQLSRGNRTMDMIGTSMRFGSNAVPAVQQMNATGTGFVDLLFLDRGNVANICAPLYVVAPRAGAAAPLPGIFATFQATTAQSGDTGLMVQVPHVNGHLYGARIAGSASGMLMNALTNDGTGSGAHAIELIQVSGASGGDPFLQFAVPGQQDFSFGIDNSVDDALTISGGSSLRNARLAAFPPTGGLRIAESATVAVPPAQNATLFMRNNAGKTEVCVRFQSGAIKVLAVEP